MSKNNFQKLYELDVNHKAKEKSGLKYLSWAWAWAEFKKVNSEATYLVDLYDGKPFLSDKDLGYMVSTTVTVGDLTIPMHLPVLDGANKAMKAETYTYSTKYKDKECKAASMFDINTAIMRCLTKNLAMFGLGLYIYAGEDIPSVDDSEEIEAANIKSWVDAIKSGQTTIDNPDLPVKYKEQIKGLL
tara:strand:- start:10598 stop:11158 length:561 start_codon:yes stop_codon:yes gene_type:complete